MRFITRIDVYHDVAKIQKLGEQLAFHKVGDVMGLLDCHQSLHLQL